MQSEKQDLPKHIVIIPDGNRRWAKKHNVAAVEGHRKGLDVAYSMSKASRSLGVKVLTIWGFSTENWNRSKSEVSYLMKIYAFFLRRHIRDLVEDGVKFKWIGRRDRVPEALKNILEKIEKETKNNKKFALNICLDYGGHDELVSAVKRIIAKKIKPSKITEELIGQNLETAGIPDPDLLIRTSGEMRTSGIMPWQTTYTELFFSKLLFPDLSTAELKRAVNDYSRRQRRFGQ